MNWFKQQLANVAGTQEPEYGASAIQPVTQQTPQYTELTTSDLRWRDVGGTNVETAIFYFMTDDGHTALAQIIYSSVAGVHTTAQFNTKIFDHFGPGQHLWCSDPLTNFGFDEEKTGFFADNLALELSASGDSYTLKSAVNDSCLVNLTVKREAPGFQAGKDGTSYFGTDPKQPWGSIFHSFWPRCSVTGVIRIEAKDKTEAKEYNLKGQALYIKALQGMKPHHAAARWNFVDFASPTYSAVLMEFTTPPSYGNTTVSIGSISKQGELLYAGPTTAKHVESKPDLECSWPEPKRVLFEWNGTGTDGKPFSASIEGDLPQRTDRVDVLSHIPGFIKSIVGGVSGARPFIYQFSTKEHFKLKVGDVEEPGQLFMEATFISETTETTPASSLEMPTTFKPIFRAHSSPGKGKGIGNVYRQRRRKLAKDNILAISKASIRKLARRGGIRRIQGEFYDEARAAIKAYLTSVLHRIVRILESDGPMNEVETLHRETVQKTRKVVKVEDVVFALKGLGRTIYGFGWYDSGVEPVATRTSRVSLLDDEDEDDSDSGHEENVDESSDESSIVG
ncbi:hypothetical protein DV738_g4924, partial [Chaetothyriales sp. CBS 135597]